MQSAHTYSKSGSRFSKGTRTYYPDEYYKRVGYKMSETASSKHRVDALGQRVRERFNEELSYTDNVKTRGIMDRQRLQHFDTEKKLKHTNSQATLSQVSKAEVVSRASTQIRGRHRPGKEGVD